MICLDWSFFHPPSYYRRPIQSHLPYCARWVQCSEHSLTPPYRRQVSISLFQQIHYYLMTSRSSYLSSDRDTKNELLSQRCYSIQLQTSGIFWYTGNKLTFWTCCYLSIHWLSIKELRKVESGEFRMSASQSTLKSFSMTKHIHFVLPMKILYCPRDRSRDKMFQRSSFVLPTFQTGNM